jgi:hypothetical protein
VGQPPATRVPALRSRYCLPPPEWGASIAPESVSRTPGANALRGKRLPVVIGGSDLFRFGNQYAVITRSYVFFRIYWRDAWRRFFTNWAPVPARAADYSRASSFAAMSSNFVTLFQFRPVPNVFRILSIAGHESFGRPIPLGK